MALLRFLFNVVRRTLGLPPVEAPNRCRVLIAADDPMMKRTSPHYRSTVAPAPLAPNPEVSSAERRAAELVPLGRRPRKAAKPVRVLLKDPETISATLARWQPLSQTVLINEHPTVCGVFSMEGLAKRVEDEANSVNVDCLEESSTIPVSPAPAFREKTDERAVAVA